MSMPREKQKLTKIMEIGAEITEVKDIDALLKRILKEARKQIKADASSIYICL
jgi:hypothetical protein